MTNVKDIMTGGPEMCTPNTNLTEAAQKMKKLDIGALPVCEDDKVVGMLTDRDIAIRAVADGASPTDTKVNDAMTKNVITIFADQDVNDAAKTMKKEEIQRLIVLDRDTNKAVGMCSLGDIWSASEEFAGQVVEATTGKPNK